MDENQFVSPSASRPTVSWGISPISEKLTKQKHSTLKRHSSLPISPSHRYSKSEKNNNNSLINAYLSVTEKSPCKRLEIRKRKSVEIDLEEDKENCIEHFIDEKDKVDDRYLRLDVLSWWNSGPSETILRCLDAEDKVWSITLKDSWAKSTQLVAGMRIHVIPFPVLNDPNNLQVTISDMSGLIVTDPQTLLSGTVVAESFSCSRKTIFQDKFKPSFEPNRGELGDAVNTTKSLILGSIMHEIYQLAMKKKWTEGIDSQQLRSLLTTKVKMLINNYLQDLWLLDEDENAILEQVQNSIEGVIDFCNTKYPNIKVDKKCLHVPVLMGIEENISSLMYGLKGKIDATLATEQRNPVPFELKTGKMTNNISHSAQVILYMLLLKDRYNVQVDQGILHYSHDNTTTLVQLNSNILRQMIQARNDLVSMSKHKPLAAPIGNEFVCSRCYQKTNCMVYHKLIEKGTPETSRVPKLFEAVTNRISNNLDSFLTSWLDTISLEENETRKIRNDIYFMPISKRVELKRCITRLTVRETLKESFDDGNSFGSFVFVLKKDFIDSLLRIGDPVIVSTPIYHSVAIGYVLEITLNSLTLSLDRDIRSFDFVIVDRDELQSGFGMLRGNLLQLMKDDRLRGIVCDLLPPRFSNNEELTEDALNIVKGLNSEQRQAIHKVINMKDYCLILGRPGTGKSLLISNLIFILAKMGMSVLFTSYTHSAVDNILLKLRNTSIDKNCILRLGNTDKMHKEVVEFAETKNIFSNVSQYNEFVQQKQLIATTCLGIQHGILMRKNFDVCIVDEASQISLPACIGPLACAKKFVLVGDHYQLSPLMRNEKSLDSSLFKHLSEAHPSHVIQLHQQYRMNKGIAQLSSDLIYNGLLICASEQVENQRLQILPGHFHYRFLDPSMPVVFININGPETKNGESIINQFEADFIAAISQGLTFINCSYCILSPFKSQCTLLEQKCSNVSTIDKFQGSDADLIILSLVRSNEHHNVGMLLKHWQRMNVALTRAKKKLIFVGNRETLYNGSIIWKKLLDYLHDQKAIIEQE